MISCPKCNATLPDGASHCQFCQATFAPTVPVRNADHADDVYAPLGDTFLDKYAWQIYYTVAGWWVLNGLIDVVVAIFSIGHNMFAMLNGVLGLITGAIGVGLILNVEAVRGIVNFLCWVNILFAIFDIVIGVVLSAVFGFFGLIIMFFAVIRIVMAGLMVYVIDVTRTRLPNF